MVLLPNSIEPRVADQSVPLNVPVKDCVEDDGKVRVDQAEENEVQVIDGRLVGICAKVLEPVEDHDKEAVAVKEVNDEDGDSVIGPVSVNQEEVTKESKLANSKVARHGCLPSFLPDDPYSNVGGLNHSDVVGSVSDGKCDFVGEFSNQRNNLS